MESISGNEQVKENRIIYRGKQKQQDSCLYKYIGTLQQKSLIREVSFSHVQILRKTLFLKIMSDNANYMSQTSILVSIPLDQQCGKSPHRVSSHLRNIPYHAAFSNTRYCSTTKKKQLLLFNRWYKSSSVKQLQFANFWMTSKLFKHICSTSQQNVQHLVRHNST